MPDYTIPNLKNACRILEFLAQSETPLSNAEIADNLSIPRSTVLRIIYTLEQENLIKKEDKRNLLGANLIRLGQKANQIHSISELAKPILQKLTNFTAETSQLSALSSDKIVILEVCDSPHPLSAHSKQGTLADLHCSSAGKALLAFMETSKQQEILERIEYKARTKNTITDKSLFSEELQRVKKQGYAIDELEYHDGIRCLAAPVLDSTGYSAFAIGITASSSRFTKAKIPSYSKHIKSLAGELSSMIGG